MKMYFCTQIADAALSILHSMASAHSDLDDAGEIVTPTPRVKRILSSPRCLPHVAQVFFSLKFALFSIISGYYFVAILFILLIIQVHDMGIYSHKIPLTYP